jgi:hypothetical protein
LKLEYLESFFYQARTAVVGGFNSNVTASLDLIATDESNHVSFLRSVLGTNAIPAPTVATFDYTAKGAFNPTVAAQYLALAQSFEDTGVRAYKGAAPLIMSNKTVLTAALNIHSVEARHASQLRAIRRAMATTGTPAPSQGIAVAPYSAAPKSWISGTDGGGAVPGATDAIYAAGNNTNAPSGITFESEANVTQGGVALSGTTITAGSAFPASAFSEAFDEGLDVGSVAKIANMFSVSGTYFN